VRSRGVSLDEFIKGLLNAYLGVIYACRQIATDKLDQALEPELRTLVPELASWAAASLRVS
jgi:hypothetical protein